MLKRNPSLSLLAVITLRNGIFISCKVANGSLHGVAHSNLVRFFLPLAEEYGYKDDPFVVGSQPNVGLVVSFRSGRPEGNAWQRLIGGGMIHGKIDPLTR